MSNIRSILTPISWLYGILIVLRNIAYDFKIFPTHRADVPIISVGNLTVGGTGKTTFIEYLLKYYIDQGIRMCVISRGYKRATTGMLVVSDGKKIYCSAVAGGDEPYQIATKFPQAIVVVDEKRSRAVDFVVTRFHPGLILLDDGFQHRSIARDLDIVMVDGRKDLTKIPLIPAGYRREPFSALRRADLFVFTNVQASSQKIMNNLGKYSTVPSIGVRYQPKRLHAFINNQEASLESLQGTRCIGFCGVGNPNAVRATFESVGIVVTDFLVYPDHHDYSTTDLAGIQRYYENQKAQFIITTEKDAVRLQAMNKPTTFPWQAVYFLEIEFAIVSGESLLKYALKEKIDWLLA